MINTALINDFAIVQNEDVICKRKRLERIRSCIDERSVDFRKHYSQIDKKLLPQFEVQTYKRVIQNENVGIFNDPARQRHSLLFAATKLIRKLVQERVDLELFSKCFDAFPDRFSVFRANVNG